MESLEMKRLLQEELQRRKDKNPAYSLRAFAKSLSMSPAQLSQLVSGKRPLTLKTFEKVARELMLSPIEKKRALEALAQSVAQELHPNNLQMKEDEFRLVSDWYHFAILSLTKVKGAKKDPVWIAKRLGIAIIDAKLAVERLERMGVLSPGETFKQITEPIRVLSEVPSQAIQKWHRQMISMATEKLSHVPVDRRDYSGMVMAIDPKNLPRAKKAIEDFQEELVSLMEQGEPTEVYAMSCQLYPLTPLTPAPERKDA